MSTHAEIKESFLRDPELLISEIISGFGKLDPERIILFGSAGRGEMDWFSDVDIMIIKNSSKRFLDRLEEAYLCWNLPFGADILVYTPDEFRKMADEGNAFVNEAVEHGKVIYERSNP